MSRRGWHERIEDILGCIQNIHTFVKDMIHDDFSKDIKIIRAVAFELSIMGESVRTIPVEAQ